MKKRKAETLIEIITAMAVFGVMLGGICDFLSNQTLNVAYIMKRDDFIYNKNLLLEKGQWLIEQNISTKNDIFTEGEIGYNQYITDIYRYDKDKFESKDAEYIEKNIVSFDWDYSKKFLVVKNDVTSVDFTLKSN